MQKVYNEIKSFSKELELNLVGAHSAQAAFFIITSFFPFMLLTISLLKFTPLESILVNYITDSGNIGIPAGDFLIGVVREISEKTTPGALLGAAGISAVWAASRCMLSIIQGLNMVYSENGGGRGGIKLRLISVMYVFALQLMLIVSLGVLVFGDMISNRLNSEISEFELKAISRLIIDSRWLIGFLLLLVFFVLVYTVVPDKDGKAKIKWRKRIMNNLPGAVLGTVGWLGFTRLFTLYIDNFANFGAVYGSLAAAVIVMLWLYFCMYILFLGGQFNVRLQRTRTP